MSDQGTEEKDLGAQDATVSAGDKPADTRIAPGVTEQNHTESEAGDAFAAQPKKRQLTSRTIGAIAACAVALVAVFAGIGYATGLFGSAQPDEQVAQQQAQEQSASASSTSVKQSTSGQPDNSQDGGDKASSAEDGKAKDENSSTDSSQEQSEGSSSEQASQSDASSGGSGASGSAASNASENSGSASSSGSAPAYQEPEPEPAPAPAPSTISVYISIDSSRAQSYGLGGFSYGSAVVLPQGSCARPALPFPARQRSRRSRSNSPTRHRKILKHRAPRSARSIGASPRGRSSCLSARPIAAKPRFCATANPRSPRMANAPVNLPCSASLQAGSMIGNPHRSSATCRKTPRTRSCATSFGTKSPLALKTSARRKM